MLIVYKYDLTRSTLLLLPKLSTVLTAQMQDDRPVLWVQIDQSITETEKRQFIAVNTGVSFDARIRAYVGTLQNSVGLVWHIFELQVLP